MSTQPPSFFSKSRELEYFDNDEQADQDYLPSHEHASEPTEYLDDDDPVSFRPGPVSEPASLYSADDSHPSPLSEADAGANSFYGDIASPAQPRVDSVHEYPSLLSIAHPASNPDASPVAVTLPLSSVFASPYFSRPKRTTKRRQAFNAPSSPLQLSRPETPNSSRSTNTAAPHSERVRVGVDQKSALWEYYNNEASGYDNELFRGYGETLNSNLLVTTLFLGLVAAFLINALNVNPAQIYANALNQAILLSLNISSNNAPSTEWSPITASQLNPPPDSAGIISVTLWGSCMVICLGTMLFATSAKSWLVEYSRDMKNGNPYMCAQKRQLRFDEMLKWKVETIISALPWFFQLSLFMFVIGLSVTLMQYHSIPGKIVISLSCIVLGGYLLTTVLPLLVPSCPYNTPALVLFLKTSRLAFQSVRGGYLYSLKKMSVVLAYCSLTSGNRTLWSKESSKSAPVHRDNSHESQLLEKSKAALSWKAVTWLLTNSQNTATMDMALRSLWNLQYIPRQISLFLPTKIPTLLYSKLSVEPAQAEEFFEQDNPEAPPEMHAFLASTRITDFLASFLHLWKCVSLDEIDSPEVLACITGKSSYSRLHPELMSVWDVLKVSCSSYMELDSEGWPYHNVVTVIGIELVYYCLHPDHSLQEKAEVGSGHPLADVKTLLGWHISGVAQKNGTMYLKHHSLRLLLDALAHALWKTDFAVLKECRKDVLALLFQLLGTLNAKDIGIFMSLATCFSMFSNHDAAVKKAALVRRMNIKAQNIYKADSNSDYLELVAAVHQTFRLYQQDEKYDSEHWNWILDFFKFAHTTNTADGLVEELLIELPDVYVENLVLHILKNPALYPNLFWLLQFIFVFYSKRVRSLALKRKMLDYLKEILCLDGWPNPKQQSRVVLNILTFLKSELVEVSFQKEHICRILILALQHSLQDRYRTVLRRFVALELSVNLSTVLDKIEDISNLQKVLKNWLEDTDFEYSHYEREVCTNMCTRYNV